MPPQLRPGNEFVDFIESNGGDKLAGVRAWLPYFASMIKEMVDRAAVVILSDNPSKGEPDFDQKSGIATLCIFDLQCSMIFVEYAKYLDDLQMAGFLMEAVHFQLIGQPMAHVSISELETGRTARSRGAWKYVFAHSALPTMPDVETWVFGREWSEIFGGDPVAMALSAQPLVNLLLGEAHEFVRNMLYGEPRS